jgi:V/A-type H+-transporting ATPase subunit E
MKEILSGEAKIQKICDAIKKDTLDPAKEHANEIIENARIESKEIINKANKEKEKIIDNAKKQIDKEKKIFETSLNLSIRQSLDSLKQKIENELFSKNLKELIIQNSKSPNVLANFINVIVKIIEEKGLDTDISAYIPKDINPDEVNKFLISHILDKLREKELVIKEFDSGVKIKLHNNQITIDMSDKAIKDIIANYIRSDFREKIFNA